MEISEWKERISLDRKGKDQFFKLHPQSPLTFDERQKFKGLDYYSPDPDFMFELELYEHEKKKLMKIEDTQGNERDFLRWGEFRFKIGGKEYKLQAYKSDPDEERLFIPFRDETSGKETYGGGRYLDLDNEHHYTLQGKWTLDFNMAYNPWCAYSQDYACPFVPPENWLNVSVRAGEKIYSMR